jgi:hypothetical protein
MCATRKIRERSFSTVQTGSGEVVISRLPSCGCSPVFGLGLPTPRSVYVYSVDQEAPSACNLDSSARPFFHFNYHTPASMSRGYTAAVTEDEGLSKSAFAAAKKASGNAIRTGDCPAAPVLTLLSSQLGPCRGVYRILLVVFVPSWW